MKATSFNTKPRLLTFYRLYKTIFKVEQKYIEKPLAVRTEIKEYWTILRPIYDKYAVHGSLFEAVNDVL